MRDRENHVDCREGSLPQEEKDLLCRQGKCPRNIRAMEKSRKRMCEKTGSIHRTYPHVCGQCGNAISARS